MSENTRNWDIAYSHMEHGHIEANGFVAERIFAIIQTGYTCLHYDMVTLPCYWPFMGESTGH